MRAFDVVLLRKLGEACVGIVAGTEDNGEIALTGIFAEEFHFHAGRRAMRASLRRRDILGAVLGGDEERSSEQEGEKDGRASDSIHARLLSQGYRHR
jgi:hypothetical protein